MSLFFIIIYLVVFFVTFQQGSVEYAQLNHDTDQHGDGGDHGNQSVQHNHIVEIDNSVNVNTAPCEEWKP